MVVVDFFFFFGCEASIRKTRAEALKKIPKTEVYIRSLYHRKLYASLSITIAFPVEFYMTRKLSFTLINDSIPSRAAAPCHHVNA